MNSGAIISLRTGAGTTAKGKRMENISFRERPHRRREVNSERFAAKFTEDFVNEQAERNEGHRGADEEARPHVLQRARNQDGEGDPVRALSLALRIAPVQ